MYNLGDINDINRLETDGIITNIEKTIIHTANQTITNLFGYNNTRSRFIPCVNKSELCQILNITSCAGKAIYNIPARKALVIKDQNRKSFFAELIHEYYGHGIFAERSEYGRKIRLLNMLFERHSQLQQHQINYFLKRFQRMGYHYNGITDINTKRRIDAEGVAFWVECKIFTACFGQQEWQNRISYYVNYVLYENNEHSIAFNNFVLNNNLPTIADIKRQMFFD